MQNEEKIEDIHERIYQFVIRVINLTKSLPKTPQNLILINQVLRSATSMGANDQEADGTDTKKDFIAKYSIVRKEGKETNYWLRLIADTNPGYRQRMHDLMQEGKEIVKIVSAIALNAKRMIFTLNYSSLIGLLVVFAYLHIHLLFVSTMESLVDIT